MKIIKRQYNQGIVTDPEPFERPEGSLAECVNLEYSYEDDVLRTRKPLLNYLALDSLTLPSGYKIKKVKYFTLNEPADTDFLLVVAYNPNTSGLKIFINKDFNPDLSICENYESEKPVGFTEQWIELTECIGRKISGFYSPTNDSFTIKASPPPVTNCRGWFVFNRSAFFRKYNDATNDDQRALAFLESWACIESWEIHGGGSCSYKIQQRAEMKNPNLFPLSWAVDDVVFFMRYPIVATELYRRNLLSPIGDDAEAPPSLYLQYPETEFEIIKTNSSIVIFTGEEGNLELNFLPKDNQKFNELGATYLVHSVKSYDHNNNLTYGGEAQGTDITNRTIELRMTYRDALTWEWKIYIDDVFQGNFITLQNIYRTVNKWHPIHFIGGSMKAMITRTNWGVGSKVVITTVSSEGYFSEINKSKYVGWWLDYQTPPFETQTKKVDGNSYNLYYPILGISFRLQRIDYSGSKINSIGLVGTLNGRHKLGLYLGYNMEAPNDKGWRVYFKPYHNYTRRLTGVQRFGAELDSSKEDPKGFQDYQDKPHFRPNIGNGLYYHQPVYKIYEDNYDFIVPIISYEQVDIKFDGTYFLETIQYLPEEPIAVKSKTGIFTHSRMFLVDADEGDAIRYSLLHREDIFPKQNKRYIDPNDKDRVIALKILGGNVLVVKENSLHLINIEQTVEVGWRLLEIKKGAGTKYKNLIAETPYGVVIGNDTDIFLVTINNEIVSLTKGRIQKFWEQIQSKKNFFMFYSGRENRLWVGLSQQDFLICHFKESGVRWYKFRFEGKAFIGAEEVEDGILLYEENKGFVYPYITTNTYNKDYPNISINWEFKDNLPPVPRSEMLHLIETVLGFEYVQLSGVDPELGESLQMTIFNEKTQALSTRTYNFQLSQQPKGVVLRNPKANRQRSMSVKVSGTLTNVANFEFTEVIHRAKPLRQLPKVGYARL